MILDRVLGLSIGASEYGPIYSLYILAVLIPGLIVSVRRLHDVGKSGWFLLVSLIPVAGIIWLIVVLCTDGTVGDNKHGANPKAAAA